MDFGLNPNIGLILYEDVWKMKSWWNLGSCWNLSLINYRVIIIIILKDFRFFERIFLKITFLHRVKYLSFHKSSFMS
jgi:hypothetical protein